MPDQTTAEPLPINRQSQLFADDYLIAERTSAHRRLNRPLRERTPFLVADQPWEGVGICYGCVLDDDDGLRLYYRAMGEVNTENCREHRAKFGWGNTVVCLARGTDGRHFSKAPFAEAAVADTNIVMDESVDDFTILKDNAATDPATRYKVLASRDQWPKGLTPGASPDGLRWTWGKPYAIRDLGDRCSYWYDSQRQRHIAWSRCYPLIGGRTVVQRETADFSDWAEATTPTPRLVMQPDRYDHAETQIYGAYGFWYRSLYFAYFEAYYVHDQRIDTQLCCSRDGLTWTRLGNRNPFLPNGEHGEFDGYWVVPTFNPPIMRDGRLLIHYGGRPDPHVNPGFTHVPPGMTGGFALATLREDGFISLDATGTEGTVLTKPLAPAAGWRALAVNACPFNSWTAAIPMTVTVDVLAPDQTVIETFPLSAEPDSATVWHECVPSRAWPEVVQLRFRLRNARLYSFRFNE